MNLHLGGFIYYKLRTDVDDVEIWRCQLRINLKCPARAFTKGETLIRESDDHNHAGNMIKIITSNFMEETKIKAEGSFEKTRSIMVSKIDSFRTNHYGFLP